MAEIPNPHDAFFKELLARPETARDFAAHYLPPSVAAALDLSTLAPTRDSFVDGELRAYYSDLLFRTELQAGKPAFIYLLFDNSPGQENCTGCKACP
jgi:predicted transposase YdaD